MTTLQQDVCPKTSTGFHHFEPVPHSLVRGSARCVDCDWVFDDVFSPDEVGSVCVMCGDATFNGIAVGNYRVCDKHPAQMELLAFVPTLMSDVVMIGLRLTDQPARRDFEDYIPNGTRFWDLQRSEIVDALDAWFENYMTSEGLSFRPETDNDDD